MVDKFLDIIAVSEGKNYCFVSLCKDRYDDYIVWCTVDLYGVPSDLSEEQENDIYNGNYENADNIGTLRGCLILCKQILDDDEDVYIVCDDTSGDLEFVMSALQEDSGPLSKKTDDEYRDVFYIEELILKKKYNTKKLNVSILNSISDIMFSLYHVYPNILCYYPRPLPFEEDMTKKIKKDMAVIAAHEIMERELGDTQLNNSEYQLALDEEQINYILGRRNSNDAYPETAKDKDIWGLYEKAGFIEVGNSRLLYKSVSL